MKRARVLFALSVAAVGATLAAACGSSSNGPGSGGSSGNSSSSSGGSSGGSYASGLPSSSGSSGGSRAGSSSASIPPTGVGVSCGPSLTCGAPLTFCCAFASDGGTNAGSSGGGDAGIDGRGNGSGSDSSAMTDASDAAAAIDGSNAGDAGGAEAAGGDDASGADAGGGDDSSAAGVSYRCSASADTCPSGSIILGCASGQNCSTTQSCCGTFPDAGFVTQCEPAPCSSGVQLCLSSADCLSGNACALNTSGVVKYGICVPGEAGAGDGSQGGHGGG